MKTFIVVWQEVPERTRAFRLTVNEDDVQSIVKLNGKFSNLSGVTSEEEKGLVSLFALIQTSGKKVYDDAEPDQKGFVDLKDTHGMIVCGICL